MGNLFYCPGIHSIIMSRAQKMARVMFIDYEHVIKRCEKACWHHSQMVSNLLQMTALHAGQQTDRIYMLSRSQLHRRSFLLI